MGGSEEAVYYISQELAKKGFKIAIFSEVNDIDDGVVQIYMVNEYDDDNHYVHHHRHHHHNHHNDGVGIVKWLHHSKYNLSDHCEVFIGWRYSISMGLGSHCRYEEITCDLQLINMLLLYIF
jgi:hypothetical protein